MATPGKLLDRLNDVYRDARQQLSETASGASVVTAAAGNALVAHTGNDVAVVAAATMGIGAAIMGYVATAFQRKDVLEELGKIAGMVDELPATWADDGTFDEFIAPSIRKHMAWRATETHEEKINAARCHLRNKLLNGKPTSDLDYFEQHVERFLADCTVSELMCLIQAKIIVKTGSPPGRKLGRYANPLSDIDIWEEDLADAAGVPRTEAYYAFRSLAQRGFVLSNHRKNRETPITGVAEITDGGGQDGWSLTPLAYRIADWITHVHPPSASRYE